MRNKTFFGDLAFPTLGIKQSEQTKKILHDTVESLNFTDRLNIIAMIAYGTLISGEGAPPFSDLELYAITRFYDPAIVRRLEKLLNERKPPVVMSVGQLHFSLLKRWKSIQACDIESSGKVFYGNPNILNSFNVLPSQIPKYDSIKILLNLGVDKLNMAMTADILNKGGVHKSQKGKFCFNCVKANITVCRALLSFVGKYRSSIAEGATLFKTMYKDCFPSLHRLNPSLADNILQATYVRLSFNYDQVRDPISYWFETRRNVKDALIFLLQNYFHKSTNNEYELISLLETFPHNIAGNLVYMIRLLLLRNARMKKRMITLRNLMTDPWIKVHIANCFLLLAVNEDNTINENLAKHAYAKLQEAFTLDKSTVLDSNAWDRSREMIIRLNESSILPQPLT